MHNQRIFLWHCGICGRRIVTLPGESLGSVFHWHLIGGLPRMAYRRQTLRRHGAT